MKIIAIALSSSYRTFNNKHIIIEEILYFLALLNWLQKQQTNIPNIQFGNRSGSIGILGDWCAVVWSFHI